MLRELIIAGAAGAIGYFVGVRAGFDAGVRDYLENNGQLLQKVAVEKDKFNYVEAAENEEEDDDSNEQRVSATFQ